MHPIQRWEKLPMLYKGITSLPSSLSGSLKKCGLLELVDNANKLEKYNHCRTEISASFVQMRLKYM